MKKEIGNNTTAVLQVYNIICDIQMETVTTAGKGYAVRVYIDDTCYIYSGIITLLQVYTRYTVKFVNF